jgi:hypothetical protein
VSWPSLQILFLKRYKVFVRIQEKGWIQEPSYPFLFFGTGRNTRKVFERTLPTAIIGKI